MHIRLENVVDEMIACLLEKKNLKPTKMTSMLADGTSKS